MKTLNQIVAGDKRIAVLTGAGVSVPSGIPPFRGSNGLYQHADVGRYLSMNYFESRPESFWAFYWSLFDADLLLGAKPNPVHLWLSSLEKDREVTVMTQNIDGLHSKAGSRHVIEVHGAFDRTVCPKCGAVYPTDSVRHEKVPRCTAEDSKGGICGTVLKPDIVLFGEAVRGFEQAENAVRTADRLLILGTSLTVTPANLLPVYAAMNGIPTLLVNDRPAVQMDSIDTFIKADFNHFDPDTLS
ncbi:MULTISPECIES: SIR2 family NAD-dependent protein deacylase [unclassified Sporolactobacillus]|uniref:SIR2 family NAD-dependent protein deacylase n=1 Tax=unclassified Sporolactobacillus TaxID=2628533 RepID=UPI0023686262|nr:Sir2 family NAD-dependent protein deacetylase [Sporolactobacillus sp. CQH2019]MDD9148773.1 NAD-dependent deacetylase [Sporolactobacillus sp. CQH2019]